MSETFWSVDSLVIRDGSLFGFGWIFHTDYNVVQLNIKILHKRNHTEPVSICAEYGKNREDVSHSFPHQPRAMKSGYVVYEALPNGMGEISSIYLECILDNGEKLHFEIPKTSITNFSRKRFIARILPAFRQIKSFAGRGVRLILSGELSLLIQKINRHLDSKPAGNLRSPADLSAVLKIAGAGQLVVIVDHDLGGGANQYRNRLVTQLINQGATAIVLSYHVASLSHQIIVKSKNLEKKLAIPNKNFFFEALNNFQIDEIIYNTAVSFTSPEDIPELLIRIQKKTGARLKLLVHDYYMVCPSHFLLNYEGRYCGVPKISECAHCLPRNSFGFSSLFADKDIKKWRAAWGTLLVSSDEITIFSRSSAKLLFKAYPHLNRHKVYLIPHRLDHLPQEKISITHKDTLRIGVVGHIGFHKGSGVIERLAEEIHKRQGDTKIVVIGTLEGSGNSQIVSQTGPYQHENLSNLIRETNVNIMLFPSICPETFSYVTHELIALQLPVASFDIGAQAEKVSNYDRGCILSSTEPEIVLNELIDFYHKIYLPQ